MTSSCERDVHKIVTHKKGGVYKGGVHIHCDVTVQYFSRNEVLICVRDKTQLDV